MQRWRARICRFTPVAVLVFTSGVAVPRPGLVFHRHPGGDHFHVHADEITGDEVEPAEHPHHDHHLDHDAAAHHHHAAALDHGAAAFEAPEPIDLGHWHSQQPFQRVVAPALVTLITAFPIRAVAPDDQLDAGVQPLPPDRARGPPVATVS